METKARARLVALAACLLLPVAAAAQQFQQGPGEPGHVQRLEGRVLALHGDCALVLADTGRPGWEGLGGGGRFFLCQPGLGLGDAVQGNGVQVGTRWTRWGPRWRVVPVYRPAR